jgi:hypothetical protein
MKLTTKILLSAFICFAISKTSAQTFTWGAASPSLKETDAKINNTVDAKFYQTNSIYNDKVFNRNVTANSYSLTNLNKEKTSDLSIGQPVMGLALQTHLEMFTEKGINNIIFLDEFNSKTKERELYWQRVNLETSEKSKPALITTMPTRNSSYFISQSPNKMFYAVFKQYNFDKKTNEKVNVTLIDKDFKVVKEISFESQYLNRTQSEPKIFVSNQGTVFVVKEIELQKMKPFKTVFYWDGNSDTMQETSLKFDNDYQIYQFQGHFDGDDFYIHGLYTRIGSKGVQMYGGGLPAAGIYAARFNGKGEKKYIESNETGEIPGLNLKDFTFDGIKTWLFADKMFLLQKNKPPVPGAGSYNFEKDNFYSNTAFVFGKLDNETGKLEWKKELKYEEPNTTNDNGTYLSYLPILNNNQLILLYNDTQKTKIDRYVMDDRFTAFDTYDANGNLISNTLIPETGLELKYRYNYGFDENFDLDTTFLVKIKDGKYIVRAKSGSNEKFGYLTF